jgi:hypothetical protein
MKQVVQGVHDDIVASQNNYSEIAGYDAFFRHSLMVVTQEKWGALIDQVEQENKPR